MNEYREHLCNEKCICPIHRTDFLYSKREKLHACQDTNCAFAHGYEICLEIGNLKLKRLRYGIPEGSR